MQRQSWNIDKQAKFSQLLPPPIGQCGPHFTPSLPPIGWEDNISHLPSSHRIGWSNTIYSDIYDLDIYHIFSKACTKKPPQKQNGKRLEPQLWMLQWKGWLFVALLLWPGLRTKTWTGTWEGGGHLTTNPTLFCKKQMFVSNQGWMPKTSFSSQPSLQHHD